MTRGRRGAQFTSDSVDRLGVDKPTIDLLVDKVTSIYEYVIFGDGYKSSQYVFKNEGEYIFYKHLKESLVREGRIGGMLVDVVANILSFDEKSSGGGQVNWFFPSLFWTYIMRDLKSEGSPPIDTLIFVTMFDNSIDHWYLLLVEMTAHKAWVLDNLPGRYRAKRLRDCLAVLRALEMLFTHEAFRSQDVNYNLYNPGISKFDLQYRNVSTQSNRIKYRLIVKNQTLEPIFVHGLCAVHTICANKGLLKES